MKTTCNFATKSLLNTITHRRGVHELNQPVYNLPLPITYRQYTHLNIAHVCVDVKSAHCLPSLPPLFLCLTRCNLSRRHASRERRANASRNALGKWEITYGFFLYTSGGKGVLIWDYRDIRRLTFI